MRTWKLQSTTHQVNTQFLITNKNHYETDLQTKLTSLDLNMLRQESNDTTGTSGQTIINEVIFKKEKGKSKRKPKSKKLELEKQTSIDFDELYFSKEQKEYYKKLMAIEDRNSIKNGGKEDFQSMKPIEWKQGKPLGQGSYGFVYEAFDLRTNKTMAVKKVFLGGQIKENNVSIRMDC